MPGKSINRYKIDYDFLKRLKKGLQGNRKDEQINRFVTSFPDLTTKNGNVYFNNKELLPIEDFEKRGIEKSTESYIDSNKYSVSFLNLEFFLRFL